MLTMLAATQPFFERPETWVAVAFFLFVGLLLYFGVPRLIGKDTFLNRNTRGAQLGMAEAVYPLIRIGNGGDDAGNAGVNERPGAGRRAAMMGAGFKRDIGGGTARQLSGLRKGDRLGMRAAATRRDAGPDNHIVAHDQARHGRVGGGQPLIAPGKADGCCHEAGVDIHG